MQCQKVLKYKHSVGMCQGNIEPTKRTHNSLGKFEQQDSIALYFKV